MLAWLSDKVSGTRSPDDAVNVQVKSLMREALAFDAVLTSEKELEHKFVLEQICQYSFDLEDRVIVMDFLHYAFAPVDPNSEWRTIFNGLRILNGLIDSGCRNVFSEVMEGKHFDLVQKTLFLTTYSNADERVGRLVRSVAKDVREKLLQKFTDVETELAYPKEEKVTSVSSKNASRILTAGNAKGMTVPGVARFTHTEESSDEESEEIARKADWPGIPGRVTQSKSDFFEEDLLDLGATLGPPPSTSDNSDRNAPLLDLL